MSASPKETKVKIKVPQDPLLRKTIGEVLVSQVVSPESYEPSRLIRGESLLIDQPTKGFIRSLAEIFTGEGGHLPFFTIPTVIKIIEDGLSTVVFRDLCDFLDISDKALAETIKLPISTLAKRKKRGYFSSTESERIYRILNLYKQALDTFDGNKEYARNWLKEDAYGLGGVPPLEFAKTELGAKEVEQLLIRIDEGIFA